MIPQGETTDGAMLASHDRRLERLLAEAEAACGPVAWPRVEALVTALVELYGLGLGRLLELAREADGREDLDARILDDEVVSSLLLVHELHPLGLESRIERALERLRAEVPNAAPLVVLGVDDGVIRLRPADPTAPVPTTHVVARAIEREAPELAGVQIDGASPPVPEGLVPAERLVRGARR